jgi:hypothetical protein
MTKTLITYDIDHYSLFSLLICNSHSKEKHGSLGSHYLVSIQLLSFRNHVKWSHNCSSMKNKFFDYLVCSCRVSFAFNLTDCTQFLSWHLFQTPFLVRMFYTLVSMHSILCSISLDDFVFISCSSLWVKLYEFWQAQNVMFPPLKCHAG